ncbi:PhoX family phosphatase [Reyranella sp. CPCC 100927]|uniref:PhoX family protein n=1 Tax=Reyranella sp. CPCC 100927 TaxID=2599616 RepID=UPI0011B58726|nr:PhoX family phosphatase [Reyranella sp. CPCC 100927]TWS95694.1 PhoX family phosphatase [Reyranella sp. CPCC 100927]
MDRPLCHDDPIDDIGRNDSANPTLGDIVTARLSRRAALGLLASTALSSVAARPASAQAASSLAFREVTGKPSPHHVVAAGYRADILIRWGDPVVAGAPAFDVKNLSAAAQDKQFGYNNDFLAYMPLPLGSTNSEHGLLVANHEYTSTAFMWSGITRETVLDQMTRERTEVELAAHGLSVVEVRRTGGTWRVVADSTQNRRVPMTTPFRVAGPAAGHDRLKTNADPTGTRVLGTLNNCAGGKTPWGTTLHGEENFHNYFSGEAPADREADARKRYGVGTSRGGYRWWGRHIDRFNLAKEPNEANRFGWIVELDPYDPTSTPVKRTALGRFKHEGATAIVNKDGRVVLYAGDDERNEYIYRFVTSGRFDPANRAANMNLLDDGVLSVARIEADGNLHWRRLVHGEGPLTAANGFASQADVLIEARRAADLMGATKMDRPEDVEPDPVTGVVYAALTNNSERKDGDTNPANPRAANVHGHILAMIPPGGRGKDADHAADVFTWTIPILAGDPSKPEQGAKYHPGVSSDGWFSSPDNVAFDAKGRLWIATDTGSNWAKYGIPDGLFACDVDGPAAYLTRRFFACPMGGEMCGPEFTPDNKTLFVAVQHPGTDGTSGSSFDTPATRWPDFKDDMPPRPSVVVITKEDGGVIGT